MFHLRASEILFSVKGMIDLQETSFSSKKTCRKYMLSMSVFNLWVSFTKVWFEEKYVLEMQRNYALFPISKPQHIFKMKNVMCGFTTSKVLLEVVYEKWLSRQKVERCKYKRKRAYKPTTNFFGRAWSSTKLFLSSIGR